MNDPALRSYLLGQTTEDDAARLEAQLLENDEVSPALQELEDDLFDEYARGALPVADRHSFVQRYGVERSRLLVAHALANRSTGARVLPLTISRRNRYWVPLAVAATIAAAVGAGFWTTRQPIPTAAASAAVVPPAIAPAVLAITLGTSRAASATPAVVLPPDVPSLELRVRLDPADTFERYAMELRSASGESVWRTETRKPLDRREPMLVGTVAADLLHSGTYELAIQGFSGAGSAEDLGFAMINIRR